MIEDRRNMNKENSGFEDDACSDPGCCPPQETIVRSTPKVGRNDPCPCDSGRKYKKCCGAAS
ncbi:SEC-C metal-binding domain-containing protein [Candidatus Marimicrobium litorale]|uniref:Zinc chelation protein SecC n=1 Tax=Candidatus Marimicrobium litorale TaxID=2518991 RepID=A0ABT3T6L1_9GAMM|nr:zinc chelation protein SecC [Candidatus Marimicrobium litorale]